MSTIIDTYSLEFNVDKLSQCIDDLNRNCTKKELLADLTALKLIEINKDYMEKFHTIVDDLYNCALNENIGGFGKLTLRLANVAKNLYRVECRLYKSL